MLWCTSSSRFLNGLDLVWRPQPIHLDIRIPWQISPIPLSTYNQHLTNLPHPTLIPPLPQSTSSISKPSCPLSVSLLLTLSSFLVPTFRLTSTTNHLCTYTNHTRGEHIYISTYTGGIGATGSDIWERYKHSTAQRSENSFVTKWFIALRKCVEEGLSILSYPIYLI